MVAANNAKGFRGNKIGEWSLFGWKGKRRGHAGDDKALVVTLLSEDWNIGHFTLLFFWILAYA